MNNVDARESERSHTRSQLWGWEQMLSMASALKEDLKLCWDDWGYSRDMDELIRDDHFFILEKYKRASDFKETALANVVKLQSRLVELEEPGETE